jgi:hypothetical protein
MSADSKAGKDRTSLRRQSTLDFRSHWFFMLNERR